LLRVPCGMVRQREYERLYRSQHEAHGRPGNMLKLKRGWPKTEAY